MAEPGIAGHGHHVVDVLLVQPGPQSGVVAVGLVRGEPRHGLPAVGGQQPLEHALGQLRLGGELDLVADPGLRAAWPIVGPGLRQVQLPVDQRPPARGHVGQKHPELAVLDPARRPGVLPLHPRRAAALLQETGLIELCGHPHSSTYVDTATMPSEQPRVFRTGFLLVLCYFLAVQPSVVNFLRCAVSES